MWSARRARNKNVEPKESTKKEKIKGTQTFRRYRTNNEYKSFFLFAFRIDTKLWQKPQISTTNICATERGFGKSVMRWERVSDKEQTATSEAKSAKQTGYERAREKGSRACKKDERKKARKKKRERKRETERRRYRYKKTATRIKQIRTSQININALYLNSIVAVDWERPSENEDDLSVMRFLGEHWT